MLVSLLVLGSSFPSNYNRLFNAHQDLELKGTAPYTTGLIGDHSRSRLKRKRQLCGEFSSYLLLRGIEKMCRAAGDNTGLFCP